MAVVALAWIGSVAAARLLEPSVERAMAVDNLRLA